MANIFNYNSGSFSIGKPSGSISGSVYTVDRLDLLTEDLATELNTYRTWDEVPMFVGDVLMDLKEGKTGNTREDYKYNPVFAYHKKSLFNNVNSVMDNSKVQVEINAPLLDSQKMRNIMHQRGLCTVGELCRASAAGDMGREIYNFSDFMYCKHLGKVSNNYLVTLRRFPYPCGDFIGFIKGVNNQDSRAGQAHLPDIGRLVTWMGVSGNEMGNILKFDVNMPYTAQKAQMQEIKGQGDSGGMLRSVLNLGNPDYLKQVRQGRAGTSAFSLLSSAYGSVPGIGTKMSGILQTSDQMNDYQQAYNHIDKNKTYGPVDSITETHRRSDPAQDEDGLKFEHEITLNFDYELRSYDGINPRAAMMDLLSNVLAVTYTTGEFWRGGYRSTGVSDSAVFTNLPIFDYANKANPATYKGVMDATVKSFQTIGRDVFGIKPGSNIKETLASIFKTLGSGVFNTLLGGALNKLGRPARQALNSLLSPAPTGLWHLTIGNPKHPIMSMGNMILTKTEISFSGPLGLDDFPTNMRVSITLKHGKGRDIADIERMFVFGDYRIYTPMDVDHERMYQGSHRVKNKMPTGNTGAAGGVNVPETTGTAEKVAEGVVKQEGTASVISQEDAMKYTGDVGSVYMKYFGTKLRDNLRWASQEAYLGSQKVNTPDENKAQNEGELVDNVRNDGGGGGDYGVEGTTDVQSGNQQGGNGQSNDRTS